MLNLFLFILSVKWVHCLTTQGWDLLLYIAVYQPNSQPADINQVEWGSI